MAIRVAPLAVGTRVRVRQGPVPQDPALTGRTGTVVQASEYRDQLVGVALDGEAGIRAFSPRELEVVQRMPLLPPERERAKALRSLP